MAGQPMTDEQRQAILRQLIPHLQRLGFEFGPARDALVRSIFGDQADYYSLTPVQLRNMFVYADWRYRVAGPKAARTSQPEAVHPLLGGKQTIKSKKALLKEMVHLASDWGRLLTRDFDPADPEASPEFDLRQWQMLPSPEEAASPEPSTEQPTFSFEDDDQELYYDGPDIKNPIEYAGFDYPDEVPLDF